MNIGPAEAIDKQILRRDLFYRFSSSIIHVPRLSDRPEDLEFYLQHFLHEFCQIYGKDISGYDRELTGLLRRYTWEGNVRELKHLVEAMVAATKSSVLGIKDMPDYVYQRITEGQAEYEKEAIQMPYHDFTFTSGQPFSLQKALEEREREIIMEALRCCCGNKAQASRLLEIPRPTLLYKMEKLGIK